MRYVRTLVFPLPAPANTKSGPEAWQTASLWAGFKSLRKSISISLLEYSKTDITWFKANHILHEPLTSVAAKITENLCPYKEF
jgi:hypothetical protein